MLELLARKGIRRHDMQGIAFDRADQRQRYPGAAPGVFDHGAAGLQAPVGLGCLDHGQRHPVLHAAGGIFVLQFQQDARAIARRDPAQGQERGIADPLQDVVRSAGDAVHGFFCRAIRAFRATALFRRSSRAA